MTQTSLPVAVPKSAFLDTNPLVNMFDLWKTCSYAGIHLDAITDWATLKAALGRKNSTTAQISALDARDVKMGIDCFRNLEGEKESYQFYTSSVCRSEMHHVVLDALASERLVRRRIPHRLRVKRPQVLYRRALESGDYLKLQRDLDEFFESLRVDYGIDIVEVEQESAGTTVTSEDVWNTARAVWSRVLIDVMDSYIYAAAVEIEADVFMTSDGSLLEALANLRNPSGEWVSLTRSLKRALGKPASASLPLPMRPQLSLP